MRRLNSIPRYAAPASPDLAPPHAGPQALVADAAPLHKTAVVPIDHLRLAAAGRRSPLLAFDETAQRHPWTSFALLSAFYLLVVACMSQVKLLWLDELITLHIARLNSVAAIWHALSLGADPNPPLTHIAVMFFRRLFGEHPFVLRLPGTIGYWVGMLALYLFLKRRLPVSWCLFGVVMSMAMGGFGWSYESRSYAIFYGTTMLALYCWTRLADETATRRARYVALAGMTLSLATGLSANYFAVLAFFPIGAAEAVRILQKIHRAPRLRASTVAKAIDWPVVACLAIAATPLLAFHTLIATSIAKFQPYAWNKVVVDSALGGYVDMLAEVLWALTGLVVIALTVELLSGLRWDVQASIWPRWFGRFVAIYAPNRSARLLAFPEAAAVAVLVAYPFLGFAVASIRGGMLSPRFVIPVCFGGAILGTLLAYRLFGSYRRGAAVALMIALSWFVVRQAWIGFHYEVQKESFFRVIAHIPPPDYPGQPVALGDNLLVLPLQYYAPPALARRIVYPVDFAAIVARRGEASGEINLWDGRNLYGFPILPLATLEHNTSTYIVVTSVPDWLVGDLISHHYRVDMLPIDTQAAELEFKATPVAHNKSLLFRASGDLDKRPWSGPTSTPFNLAANLPKN